MTRAEEDTFADPRFTPKSWVLKDSGQTADSKPVALKQLSHAYHLPHPSETPRDGSHCSRGFGTDHQDEGFFCLH